jgi:hypothetical protein
MLLEQRETCTTVFTYESILIVVIIEAFVLKLIARTADSCSEPT